MMESETVNHPACPEYGHRFSLLQGLKAWNPWRLMLVQSTSVLVASIPFAHAYFLSRSIVPPMLFHFTWNIINPAVLGDIYQNQAGIVVGNMLYINGEALAGIIAGLPFVVWFMFRKKQKNRAGPGPAQTW